MRMVLQVVAAVLVMSVAGVAAEPEPAPGEKRFEFKPLEVTHSIFGQDLDMLDREREEYATNLATHAANRVAASGGDVASLEEARRMLALSRHLSPRNRKALVVSFQLARGILPEASESDYSRPVLARLLLARAQLLEKQPGEANATAGRCFVEIAVALDPRNEDAAYAFELKRLDGTAMDWKKLTEAAASTDGSGDPAAGVRVAPPVKQAPGR
jgi:hypothetical protein